MNLFSFHRLKRIRIQRYKKALIVQSRTTVIQQYETLLCNVLLACVDSRPYFHRLQRYIFFIKTNPALLSIPQALGKYRYTKQVVTCPDNQCVYYSLRTLILLRILLYMVPRFCIESP